MVAVIEVAPEVKQGRNKLAFTVVGGHAIKHIYNSALSTILLPEIGITLGLSGASAAWPRLSDREPFENAYDAVEGDLDVLFRDRQGWPEAHRAVPAAQE